MSTSVFMALNTYIHYAVSAILTRRGEYVIQGFISMASGIRFRFLERKTHLKSKHRHLLEEALEEFYTQHTNILVCELSSYNIEWQGSCVFYFNFLPSQRKMSNRVWRYPILSN